MATDLWVQHSNLAPGGFGRVMREDQFKEAIAALIEDVSHYVSVCPPPAEATGPLRIELMECREHILATASFYIGD